MNELVPSASSTSLTVFLPEEAKIKDAKADAVIEYAQNIKDWPLLMEPSRPSSKISGSSCGGAMRR